MTTLLAAISLASTPLAPLPAAENWLSVAGIQAATFRLDEGTVTVYAPRDLMAGDRFSGSVFCEPAGDSSDARMKNMDTLMGYRLSVLGAEAGVNAVGFTVNVPSDAAKVELSLRKGDGMAMRNEFGLMAGSFAPRSVMVSPIITRGGALFVAGPFDGDRRTSSVKIDGQTVGILTESPRGMTVGTGAGLSTGRHSVTMNDGTSLTHNGGFNVVRSYISDKGMRVGKTNLTVLVEGLQGADSSAFPLTVRVTNDTPQKLSFLPEGTLQMSVPVTAADTKDGLASVKVPVKVLRRGEFRVSSFVAADAFHASMMR
jgi:hypothetical protein